MLQASSIETSGDCIHGKFYELHMPNLIWTADAGVSFEKETHDI